MTQPGIVTDADEDLRTAYHEAGHTVIGLLHKHVLESVTIEPDNQRYGGAHFKEATHFNPEIPEEYQGACEVAMIAMAGVDAERRCIGKDCDTLKLSAERDEDKACEAALFACRPHAGNPDQLVIELRERVSGLLLTTSIWRAVESIATALLERRTLTGDEASGIFNDAIAQG